ncbi:MFS transporter [Kaustia mangrovi]|uniref:MFS transporter n=1 Tax=Kaustia mangrovi TaxID=2593653 RepID=A0A7S8C1V2_9HYPH|nr:MFS transporter [Kaustia mangrovi]QPC41822.1 MFS transporter [Kaustia mangrovi]
MPASAFARRVSMLYAALFACVGIYLPYLPLWLGAKGMDTREIAAILAAQVAVRLVTGPFCAFLADRTGRPRRMMVTLAALSILCLAGLSVVEGFWPILLLTVVMAGAWTPVLPLAEAFAISGAERFRLDYGRLRLWGSLSFIAASAGTGMMLDRIETAHVIFVLVAAQIAFLLVALSLPTRAVGGETLRRTAGVRLSPHDVGRLVRAPLFLVFLGAASLTQASHGVFYAFGSLHWQELGYSGGMIGALWALGVWAEVALFAMSGRIMGHVGAAGLIALGAGMAMVRWTGMAFDPGLWPLVGLQVLHAFTFGATHLGTMHFLLRAVPQPMHNTAQGLYATVSGGVMMSLVTWASGPLYRSWGGLAYLGAAALGAMSLVLALLLVATWRGGHVAEPPETRGGA